MLITNSDIYHLTINTYHEARGESDKGIKAVVKVVLNRVTQRDQTIRHVIYDPYQFSWTMDPKKVNSSPLYFDPNEYHRCRDQVIPGIKEWENGDTLYNANLYHAVGIPFPSWTKRAIFIEQIGNHLFYREYLK